MEKKDSRELFEEFKSVIESFAECMDDYLYVYDINNDLYYISQKALDRFGLPSNQFNEVVAMHEKVVYREDLDLIMEDLNRLIGGKQDKHDLVYRWMGRDGTPVWINCQGIIYENQPMDVKFLIGCINEIGLKQRADNVSGLLGERSLISEMEAGSSMPGGFILRAGIDDFKVINEKMGTTYGDFVLRSVAECISASLQRGQSAYRIVSDEFVVLDAGGGTEKDAVRLYQEIRSRVDDFLESVSYESVFTVSAGIVMSSESGAYNYEEMTKLTQYALGEAKQRGKNQAYVFCREDYDKFLRRRRLLSALRASVANDYRGFELFFQPIVDMRTGGLFAAESLARFRTEDGSMVSPGEFIPVLEESGLIIPAGKWIVQQAVETCKKCREVLPDFHVTVNLSYIQLLKSPVFDMVKNTIDETGLNSSGIVVELTESGYLDSSPAMQGVWTKFKDEGVNIAIDDFGTGYSNLINIGDMMPHIVKIDRGFTLRALNNQYENDLLRHIINMVHNLGIKIVVEGVETEEELRRIEEMGPDYIQGFYYGKPCPADTFYEEFIVKRKG